MNPQRIPLIALVCVAAGCFAPASPEPGMEADTDAMASTTAASTESPSGGLDASTGQPGTTVAEVSTGAASMGAADAGETEDDEDIEFLDTFDRDTGAWMFVDDLDAMKEGPSDWVYQGGDLVQRADISGLETLMPSAGTYALGGDQDWDAYLVEIAYTADDDGVAGVVCHANEDGDFVRLELDHETGIVRLVERRGGATSIIAETAAYEVPMALEVERTMSFECGATYRGFIDGMLWVEAKGDAEAEGGVGMYASSIGDGPAGLRFHSIEVQDD